MNPKARSLGMLTGGILLSGVLIAGLLTASWIVLGSPSPAGATWMQVTRVGAEYTGAPTEPFYFLALGNDGRSDADKGLGDAIHVIGINPALGEGTMLNVPRDTQAPGGDKINASHSLEGLPGIVRELNEMMGIQINYAITTNFGGFIEMVDAIGGTNISVPMPLSDPDGSGANFPDPGTFLVRGQQALEFSRDRHDFTAGDIDRTYNQGTIILSTLAKLQTGPTGAAETMRLVSILVRHIRMENVGITELFRLGQLALTLDPAKIKNITIPVGGGSATNTNLQITSDGPALFADFADDAVVQSR
ncbi:MAG: LCP family protein [Acidimicrobiia bacterium]|jgi:LCP family protein required for cell wall assembly